MCLVWTVSCYKYALTHGLNKKQHEICPNCPCLVWADEDTMIFICPNFVCLVWAVCDDNIKLPSAHTYLS